MLLTSLSLFLQGRNFRVQKFQQSKYQQNPFSRFWPNIAIFNSAKINETSLISKISSVKLKKYNFRFLCVYCCYGPAAAKRLLFFVIFSNLCWKEMHHIYEIFITSPWLFKSDHHENKFQKFTINEPIVKINTAKMAVFVAANRGQPTIH